LVETVRAAGLDRGLSEALAPWRKPLGRHDPGKIVTDLAIALAVGGDCLADVAVLRAEPSVFGPVASDPTVSRLVDTLAADADHALKAIDAARSAARVSALRTTARAWTVRWSSTSTRPWSRRTQKGTGGSDVQEGVRVPPADGVRRPRRAGAAAGRAKAQLAREFGISRETVYQYLRLSALDSDSSPSTVAG